MASRDTAYVNRTRSWLMLMIWPRRDRNREVTAVSGPLSQGYAPVRKAETAASQLQGSLIAVAWQYRMILEKGPQHRGRGMIIN